jgi:hypothetical protein
MFSIYISQVKRSTVFPFTTSKRRWSNGRGMRARGVTGVGERGGGIVVVLAKGFTLAVVPWVVVGEGVL